MTRRSISRLAAAGLLAISTGIAANAAPSAKPLKALLVIGGCCHDYAKQKEVLKAGLEERANLVVDIVHTTDSGTQYKFPQYAKKDWAAGYDVIIHDECTSDVKEVAFVETIVAAHRNGVPAVNLHCAMHCYRVGTFQTPVAPGSADALWFDMLGLQSSGHGSQQPIAVSYTDAAHPITKGFANWTTVNEELYNNISVFPSAHPLARGRQGASDFVVAWTNEFGPKKTRIFSTTLGHNTDTVADARYLDLVARGLLWACGKLDEAGHPATGYGPASPAK